MDERLSAEEALILRALRIYLSSGEPTELNGIQAPDWSTVYRLAFVHHVLPMVFETIQKAPGLDPDPDMYKKAKSQTIAQVVAQYRQTTDYDRLLHDLQAAGLHPLTVKGPLCASLYPKPEQRITADHDMLVSPAEFSACCEKLSELGFIPERAEHESRHGYEVSFRNATGSLHIEVHHHLFDMVDRELNGLFDDVFDNTAVLDGYLTMSPQKTLLFLILHAYKHFINSGVGIRQVCDIGLWVGRYGDRVDWSLLWEQLATVHAVTFAKALLIIARDHLGLPLSIPQDSIDSDDNDLDVLPLLTDMLDGGVYGSGVAARQHTATITLNAVRNDRKGKKPSMWRTLFPSVLYFKVNYPFVRKAPILLPVAWMMRMVGYLWKSVGKKDDGAYASIRMGKQRVDLLRFYGIIR